MTPSERVSSLLEEQNKSEKDLASFLNVSYNTVRTWKNKQNIPPAQHLCSIADFLGISVRFLLTGYPERNQNNLPKKCQDLVDVFQNLNTLQKNEVLYYAKELYNIKDSVQGGK